MSTTSVIELAAVPVSSLTYKRSFAGPRPESGSATALPGSNGGGLARSSTGRGYGELPAPSTAPQVAQRWNSPRRNVGRLAACFWGFVVMGANDAAYGALIPYIETYYSLSYAVVSLIFLAPFVGYVASAILNNAVHNRFGQRGVAIICSGCHMIAYLVTALHPPYPVVVIAFLVAGFGNGLTDAAWNAFASSLAHANEVLGFLHGFYGLGAVLSPLVATTMITKAGTGWYAFYYIMLAMSGLEMASAVTVFWTATGREYRDAMARHAESATAGSTSATLRDALMCRPSARVTWLCAAFLLGYVGIEVALGGWIVVFMIRVRGGGDFASGMTATGFWLGIAVGRVILGFVTPRVGEKVAILVYLVLVMALEILFWLVPRFIVSAVAIGLQGFFLGPLFPAAIVAMSKLLPRHLHVSAIGFAASFGGSGGAILPFAVGALAQAKGVQVLQPIVLAFLAVILVLWLCLPKFDKKEE